MLPTQSNQAMPKHRTFGLMLLLVVLVLGSLSAYARMQKPLAIAQFATGVAAAESLLSVVIVVHIDVTPPFTESAVKQLREYRADTLEEPGVKRVDVLQQVGRANHFTVVEEWATQSAYDEHVGASHTRQFRANLQSMLGAPFDERPHRLIASSTVLK
jgi:quinol monooxygenase YgiN